MICLELKELKKTIQDLKTQGKKIVFTNGCFDLIHLGHVRYLKEAKKLGDVLIVGLNSDRSVKKIKGELRPIIPEKERAEIVDSLKPVDYVVIFSENDPNDLIENIKPDIHAKGGDYKIEELPESKLMESFGGKTIVLSDVEGKSTTTLIEKILELEKGRKNDRGN